MSDLPPTSDGALGPPVAVAAESDRTREFQPRSSSRGPAWLRAVRPRQWLKNLLVLAAPVAGGSLLRLDAALGALAAFVVFCVVSSGCYLLNDALDVKQDRLHPTKARRPVAAGEIRAVTAGVVGVVLMLAAVAAGAWWDLSLGLTVATYVAVQLGYLAGLKQQPAIDLAVVSSGFLLRAVAGGVATHTALSSWFLLVATFGALFVVAGKRYSEMVRVGADAGTRASLHLYSASYLRFVWTLAAGLTVTVYLLWALTGPRAVGSALSWEACSVAAFILCVLRYAARVDHGAAEHPEEIVMRDRVLQVVGLVWLVLVLCGAMTS